jgi:hypothetical protein
MAEFKRSRLERKQEDEITKKTVFLGLITVTILFLVLIFGLPLLVKFSVLLGEAKSRNTKDTVEKLLPPLPPRLVIPFEATKSGTIKVSGVAEPKTEVELLKEDVSIGKVKVTDNGEFSFENILLEKGENTFFAIAYAEKNGNSEISKSVRVVFDDEAPVLSMINPVEDKLKVDAAEFDVIGKSEPGVSVAVNGRFAVVDDEGKFKIRFQLNSGKNDIEVKVVDLAGNETSKKVEIT